MCASENKLARRNGIGVSARGARRRPPCAADNNESRGVAKAAWGVTIFLMTLAERQRDNVGLASVMTATQNQG